MRKKETRQSLRRVQPPVAKPQLRGPNFSKDSDHMYVNGVHLSHLNERPSTVELKGGGKRTPKAISRVEPKIHAGPPKFRRSNSADNILTNITGPKKALTAREQNNNVSGDEDGDYEEMPDVIEIKPYAVHDVIPPSERLQLANNRNGPARPAPPSKVVRKMKPSSPTVSPRVPRGNTIATLGSAVEQKLVMGMANSGAKPKHPQTSPKLPRPSSKELPSAYKVPQSPKLPQSPRRNRKMESSGKEVNHAIRYILNSLSVCMCR